MRFVDEILSDPPGVFICESSRCLRSRLSLLFTCDDDGACTSIITTRFKPSSFAIPEGSYSPCFLVS